jgi:hypothetical protein
MSASQTTTPELQNISVVMETHIEADYHGEQGNNTYRLGAFTSIVESTSMIRLEA